MILKVLVAVGTNRLLYGLKSQAAFVAMFFLTSRKGSDIKQSRMSVPTVMQDL